MVAALAQFALSASANSNVHLLQLLDQGQCRECQLQDTDLVHADLRDADLRGAQLQRANLGRARLDGAQLSGADLSFTNLRGASLRGADLRGARLQGTDLRQSDLSEALLDEGALSSSHWQRALGVVAVQQLGYAELHNAGVDAAWHGRQPEAERLFSDALVHKPDAAISWLARGISRGKQGKLELAAQDFRFAASLYTQQGDMETAQRLDQAAEEMLKPDVKAKGGNGMGSQLLNGAMQAIQVLAPLATKMMLP